MSDLKIHEMADFMMLKEYGSLERQAYPHIGHKGQPCFREYLPPMGKAHSTKRLGTISEHDCWLIEQSLLKLAKTSVTQSKIIRMFYFLNYSHKDTARHANCGVTKMYILRDMGISFMYGSWVSLNQLG